MITLTDENKHYLKRCTASKGMKGESEYINALLDHLRRREALKYATPHFLHPDFKN